VTRRSNLSALILFLSMVTVPNSIIRASAVEPSINLATTQESTAITETPLGCASLDMTKFLVSSPEASLRIQSEFGCGMCSDSPCKSTDMHHACGIRQGGQLFFGTCEEVINPPYECAEDNYLTRCTCMFAPP